MTIKYLKQAYIQHLRGFKNFQMLTTENLCGIILLSLVNISDEGKVERVRVPHKQHMKKLEKHSFRVGKVSRVIANNIGLPKEEVNMIGIGGTLHDVGKSFIPLEILNKPGKLTLNEYDVIKTHPQIGFDILISEAKSLIMAAIIALHHHEKPMGTGYAGITHIHTYAKLVAVADVFDALISARSYKDGWTPTEVIEYMKKNENKEFEAEYINILFKSLDEILEIYKRESQLLPQAQSL